VIKEKSLITFFDVYEYYFQIANLIKERIFNFFLILVAIGGFIVYYTSDLNKFFDK